MGLFACVSALFAATMGVVLLIAPGWAGWGPHLVGDVLLFLAAFFFLVAARLWLGKRRWLDRVVNAMFAKAYWCLVVLVLLFSIAVGVGITIGLWKDVHGH
jgi:hypothetical protein